MPGDRPLAPQAPAEPLWAVVAVGRAELHFCPCHSTESSPPAATAHATGDAAAHAAGGKSMVPVLSEEVLVASARDTLSGRRCRGRGGGQDPREKGRGEKFILRVAFGNGTPFQRPAAV